MRRQFGGGRTFVRWRRAEPPGVPSIPEIAVSQDNAGCARLRALKHPSTRECDREGAGEDAMLVWPGLVLPGAFIALAEKAAVRALVTPSALTTSSAGGSTW